MGRLEVLELGLRLGGDSMNGLFDFFKKIKKRKMKRDRDNCIQYIGGEYINICEDEEELSKGMEERLEEKTIETVLEENPIVVIDREEDRSIEEYGEAINKAGRGRPSGNTLAEFERIVKLNHSSNTVRNYLAAIKYWDRIAKNRKKSIYKLTARDIEEALEKYSNKTRIVKMASLRKLAKIYLRNGYPSLSLETNLVMIRSKKENHIVQYLDEEAYENLKKEVREGLQRGEREYLWIGLFLFCGLRISEIQTIIIENDKFIKVLGKGNKERLVPCQEALIEAIRNFKKDGYGGWKKNGKTIDSQLRRKGYLDNFHCHQLRHTFATNLYRKGVQLNTIKDILGHNTIMTTQVYAKAKVDEGILNFVDRI